MGGYPATFDILHTFGGVMLVEVFLLPGLMQTNFETCFSHTFLSAIVVTNHICSAMDSLISYLRVYS